MTQIKIFHNPRCSKSRNTLELINNAGVEVEIIEYLKTPPTAKQLKSTLSALKMTPSQIMRKNEAEFKQAGLDDQSLSESEQIDLMCQFPKVIERPIVIKGNQAIIGRPPENVLELL
jgi:arsenate reductase (glutaredoxin)